MTILIDKKAVPHRTNIEDYQEEILALHDESFCHNDAEILRRIGSYAICSFRINHKGRIIYTHDQGNLVILNIMLDHKYERLPLLDCSEKKIKQKCCDSTELKFSKPNPLTSSDAVNLEPFEPSQPPSPFLHRITLPLLILHHTKSEPSTLATAKIDDILQQFLDDAEPKRILYLTQNHNLAQTIREKWGEKLPNDFEIEFTTYNAKFLINPQVMPASFADFYKYDRNLKNILNLFNAQEIYKEFQLCLIFEKSYLHLDSSFHALTLEERTYIYNAFLDYQNKHRKTQTIDPNFKAIGENEKLYDLIILEEAQFLSLFQLTHIANLARNHSVIFSIDETELLLDNHSISALLEYQLHLQDVLLNTLNFSNNSILTTKFSAVLKQIKKYKKQIIGETNEELTSSPALKNIPSQEKTPQFYLLSTTEFEDNKENPCSKSNTKDIAIVTNEKFIKEAKKLFKTDSVYLPKEIVGKKFHTVVVYQLFADPTSKEFFRELSQKQKSSSSHTEKNKSNSIDHKYVQWMNAFYVACSKALETLFVIENQTQHNLTLLQTLKSLSDKIPKISKPEPKTITPSNESTFSLMSKPEKKGKTPILNQPPVTSETDVNKAIFKALDRNNMRYFKSLLNNPQFRINQIGENGQTPLIYALSLEQGKAKPFVELLLKHPQININLTDPSEGYSPLMHALLKQDKQIIKLFLSHPKLDLNLNTSNYGHALNLAISRRLTKTIKLILSHAKCSLSTAHLHGHSPLFYALDDIKLFKELFKHPDLLKDIVDAHSHNLFVNAVIHNKLAILEFLLNQKELNLNFGIPNQRHILNYLIEYFIKNNISINPALRLLLHKANLDFNPSSSLELAFSAKRYGLVKVLLKNPERLDLKTKENLGNRIANYLLSHKDVDYSLIHAFLSNKDILHAFLKNVISHNKHQDFLPHISLFFPYQEILWEMLQNFEVLHSHMMQESYEKLLDEILYSNTKNPHFIYSVLAHQKASSRHCLFSKSYIPIFEKIQELQQLYKPDTQNRIDFNSF